MKKSNNKKTRDVTAFIYPRLSRDDNLEGESYSISNQKKLLTKTAKDMGYTNIVTFVDDGVSGVTMDRPGCASWKKAGLPPCLSRIFPGWAETTLKWGG